MDVLPAKTIVGRLSQSVGNDIRQQHPNLRMLIRDFVKVGR
jgi:hypothetical protein